MNKSEFMARVLKDRKLKEKKREIDVNNCIADGCTRAWNSQRSSYRLGQR